MVTQQDYIKKSILERICLKNIFQKLSNNYDWKFYFTSEEGYDLYDALLIKFEKNGTKMLNQYFIEIKVRDKHYDTLMLERTKYNHLKDLVKKYDKRNYSDIPSEIIYINTTPNGSYWFNLSKINMEEQEWIQESHWSSTTDKSKGKELKWLTYLPLHLGKIIPVKSTDSVHYDNKVIERVMTNQKQNNGLYNFLFNK